MKTTTKKAGPKLHYARYVGGLASVIHSGRLSKIRPFMFSGRAWVFIPKDPFWMCVKCNRSYLKGLERDGGKITTGENQTVNMLPDKNGKPTYCGNKMMKFTKIVNIQEARGAQAYEDVCKSQKFTDTVNRRFFKSKAESNPFWEYKTE